MDNVRGQVEQFQDELIFFTEKASESVYDQYLSGELSETELENIYRMLCNFTRMSEVLLKILNKNYRK